MLPSRRRIPWIVIAGCMLVVAAVYGSTKLYQYSDMSRLDPSPSRRPKINAPFITTADPVIDKMIEIGEITDQDLVYDLGCGDGRIVIGAAVQRGCRGIGIDIDPVRVAEAKENAKRQRVEHLITIEEHDVFKVDLAKADVIVAYLLPWMLRDLKPSFDKCEAGTRIITHDFEIEGVEADKKVEVDLGRDSRHVVFRYTTPLKRLPPKKNRKFVWE
jgi:SAM-dependent methyltransferase